MVQLTYWFHASGDAFSPADAESRCGVRFSRKAERGEIAERGRYRGQPCPYGWGDLCSSESEIDAFLRDTALLAAASAACGATDCSIHIDVAFDAQCNLEMSGELVVALGKLALPLTITCYEDPDAFRTRR